MIVLILAGIVAILLWYKFIRPLRHFSDMGVKQTNPWPLFGDEWKSTFGIRSFYENLHDIYRMYPNNRYTGFFRFTVPMLLIKDLDLIKQVTVKDFDHFTDHRPIGPSSSKVAAGNLFMLKGQKWRETRATLSGAFTSSKMKQIFHVMKETGENFTQYFLNKNDENIEVEMKDTFTRFTNDVIASAAFGIKVDSLNEPENSFYLTGKELTDLSLLSTRLRVMLFLISPFLAKIFNLSNSRARVMAYFRDVIHETIKVREEKGIVRQDMINLLLETRKGVKNDEDEAIDTGFATAIESADIDKFKKLQKFSDDDIVAQAFVFFFAGFDTVSTAMCFGSYELALNKDVQDKLRKEIVEAHKANKGELTYEVLMSMKYLDMVVSETLRKWPPAAGMDRVATKPYTIEPINKDEKPVHLNVGDTIFLPIVPLHRDPAYFPNPEKFDPERFSDENKSSIRPGSYAPFGFGPRNCIGSRFALLEVKTLLYYLILNFEVSPTGKTKIPLKISPKSRTTTMEGGLWLGLKRVGQ